MIPNYIEDICKKSDVAYSNKHNDASYLLNNLKHQNPLNKNSKNLWSVDK